MSRGRHRLAGGLLVLIASLVGACMRYPPLIPLEPSASELTPYASGCWIFPRPPRVLSWLPSGTHVRFDSVRVRPLFRADTSRTLFQVRLFADTGELRAPRFSRWGVESGEHGLWATFSSGFSGVSLRMELHGDTLRGRAGSYSDVEPFRGFWHSVRAVRTTCP